MVWRTELAPTRDAAWRFLVTFWLHGTREQFKCICAGLFRGLLGRKAEEPRLGNVWAAP